MKTIPPLHLRILLGVGILLLAGFSALPLIPPRPLSANAPAARFSAERAMRDLAVIAREPHGAGSEAQARVRDYIVEQVSALGLHAEIQTSGQISNILVQIPGTASTGTLLVTGHYDSHPPAPGAGDDGISTAAILETIRVLRANPPLANDVLFLFTDGEELGWKGASAFIQNYPDAKEKIDVVLCFDAVPGNAPLTLVETSPGDAWLVRHMVGAPLTAWAGSWRNRQERSEQATDFDTFQAAGFTGVVFENEGSGTRYHTARDTVDAISPDLMQSYGKTILGLTNRFGKVDLRSQTRGPDLIFSTLPLVGLVAYPGWLMSALSGLALLALLGFVIVAWQRKRFSLGRFLLGLLGLLLGILIIVAVAQMIWGAILKNHAAEVSAYDGFEASSTWISWLMAAATLLMVILLYLLARRLGGINLAIGSILLFLFAGFVFYRFADGDNPLTATWLSWPLLGAVTGIGTLLLSRDSKWNLALLLLSVFLMFALTVPRIMLATYTREDAWMPVLVLCVWVGLFVPQVEAIVGQPVEA